MYCPKCNHENDSENYFCELCGTSLITDESHSLKQRKNKESSPICPHCLKSNEMGDKFCAFCGTLLSESSNTSSTTIPTLSSKTQGSETISNTSPKIIFSSSENDGSLHQSQNSSYPPKISQSSHNSKKWIIWGSILGVTAIFSAGIFWFTNLNQTESSISSLEIQPIIKSEEKNVISTSKSNYFLRSSETSPSSSNQEKIDLATQSRNLDNIQFSEKASFSQVNSNFMLIDTVSEPLIAINYSGPSCAVMALSAQDIFVSQSTLGQQLGLTEGKVTDYRDLRDLMNQYLANEGSNVRYTGYYYLLDYTTVQEQKAAFETFLNRVDNDLNQGKVPLVVVGKSPDGTLQRNSYALITGKAISGTEYRIKIPYLTETKEYLVDLQTLLDIVYAPEALCYLY